MFADSELSRKANFRHSRPDMQTPGWQTHVMPGSLHVHLRAHRKRRRLTLEAVAAEMGMSKSSLSEKENGIKPVTLDELERLALVYGVSPHALLLAPDDGPRAEAMRQAAEIARTREEEATRNWIAMGRHMPNRDG
jgi:transcriptional regulator with XRE-family HTH domain